MGLAAFDLKPVNQSGQGDGLWLSFYNPYPSIASDPASLSRLNQICLYSSRWHPWMIPEISVIHSWFSMPVKKVVAGTGVFLVGHKLYKEKTAWFGLGTQVNGFMNAGIALNMHRLKINGYGESTAVTTTASIQQNIGSLSFGLIMDNPFRARTGKENEPLPFGTILSIGTGNRTMFVQGEWKIGSFLSTGTALNMTYSPVPYFNVALTTKSKPKLLRFSLQVNLKTAHVSYSTQYSIPMQRITHQVGFGISAGRTHVVPGMAPGTDR